MVTIKDIAKLARVSESTASKALNDRPDIGEKTKKRIQEIAKRKNFTPHALGRALRTKTTGNIGLILYLTPEVKLSRDPFFTFILEGVEAEAAIEGFNVILSIPREPASDAIPKILQEKRVDGLVVIGIMKRSILNLLAETKVPQIHVDPQIPVDHFSKVMIDNERGGREITQLLIRKGHERIAFIADDLKRLSFIQRCQGYRDALKSGGIPFNPQFVGTEFRQVFGRFASNRGGNRRPTAVVFGNDNRYIESLEDIRAMSLKVPADLSVVGFDDIFQARQLNPPLTTVRVYKEEMGSLAVRNLIRMIRKKDAMGTTTIVPVKIVERESVRALK